MHCGLWSSFSCLLVWRASGIAGLKMEFWENLGSFNLRELTLSPLFIVTYYMWKRGRMRVWFFLVTIKVLTKSFIIYYLQFAGDAVRVPLPHHTHYLFLFFIPLFFLVQQRQTDINSFLHSLHPISKSSSTVLFIMFWLRSDTKHNHVFFCFLFNKCETLPLTTSRFPLNLTRSKWGTRHLKFWNTFLGLVVFVPG